MERKEWAKARPYAEAAAQTWANWAMQCAGRCAEGEQDWDRAEGWFRNIGERYTQQNLPSWYFFCKRTGHGDIAGARQFIERYIEANAARPDVVPPAYIGTFYWLDGRLEAARGKLAEAYEKTRTPTIGLALAMVADELKDGSRRDAVLEELTSQHMQEAPKTLTLCKLFLDSVRDPAGGKKLELSAVERGVQSVPEEGRATTEFVVGWWFKNHGEVETATNYLRRCSDSPRLDIWYRYLAQDALKHLPGKSTSTPDSP
jgi:hypothetical protein